MVRTDRPACCGPPAALPTGGRASSCGDFRTTGPAYRALEFDVRVVAAAADSVPMSIRLDDYVGTHDNLGARLGFFATRQWRTVRFDLTEARLTDDSRPLDTSDMELILVYLPRPAVSVTYELDNFRLGN